MHAAVAHVHAVDDGISKRSAALDYSPAHGRDIATDGGRRRFLPGIAVAVRAESTLLLRGTACRRARDNPQRAPSAPQPRWAQMIHRQARCTARPVACSRPRSALSFSAVVAGQGEPALLYLKEICFGQRIGRAIGYAPRLGGASVTFHDHVSSKRVRHDESFSACPFVASRLSWVRHKRLKL